MMSHDDETVTLALFVHMSLRLNNPVMYYVWTCSPYQKKEICVNLP